MLLVLGEKIRQEGERRWHGAGGCGGAALGGGLLGTPFAAAKATVTLIK